MKIKSENCNETEFNTTLFPKSENFPLRPNPRIEPESIICFYKTHIYGKPPNGLRINSKIQHGILSNLSLKEMNIFYFRILE